MNKPKKKPFRQVLMVASLSIMMLSIPFNTTNVKAYSQSFLDQVGPAAVKMGADTGFFPSVAIAQTILESGWGTSALAQSHNNILGITTTGGYRSFSSFEESIQYYGTLFTRNAGMRRHYSAFINASTPEEAAHALTGTYAQDSGYGSKLITLMNRYNLYRFDDQVQQYKEQQRLEEQRRKEEEERKRKEEEERAALLKRIEEYTKELKRLDELKSIDLKYEEAYKKLIIEFEDYEIDHKLDISTIEFNGVYYSIKTTDRSVLEIGE